MAGDAADALLKVAEDAGCDLLVVGNRGMAGVRRFVLGSVPNKLSHHCPSSLLIVDTSEAARRHGPRIRAGGSTTRGYGLATLVRSHGAIRLTT